MLIDLRHDNAIGLSFRPGSAQIARMEVAGRAAADVARCGCKATGDDHAPDCPKTVRWWWAWIDAA